MSRLNVLNKNAACLKQPLHSHSKGLCSEVNWMTISPRF